MNQCGSDQNTKSFVCVMYTKVLCSAVVLQPFQTGLSFAQFS